MAADRAQWWRDAVIYQVYVRSFQDSNGDGVGDLPGVAQRLDHLAWLGIDAIWLSPIYPSPLADSGYDVADHTAVDPTYGTLADFDRLVAECHRRGIRVLLDLVASHTSIEHPWFREHPDWYVRADDGPANNWRAAFGGSAWSRDALSRRWYLHSFYPEQPDLDWRNPAVRTALAQVIEFWRNRGVDGFRVDAVDRLIKDRELRDDPPASGPAALPLHPEHGMLDHVHSRDDPEISIALAALREAAGDATLIGEVYLPNCELGRYLEHLDLVFSFEFLHSTWDADALLKAIESALPFERIAWVLSNHDFGRLATSAGEHGARTAALLLLTLPGAAFIYQGDEIGMVDGPGADPPIDRAGRDRHRHPMQWEPSPDGGFTSATPWLPLTDPGRCSVAAAHGDPDSLLHLVRRLIAIRRAFGPGLSPYEANEELVAYERGEYLVVANLSSRPHPAPRAGEPVLATATLADRGLIPPHAGVVFGPQRASA